MRGRAGVYKDEFLPLFGDHQAQNAALALATAFVYLALGLCTRMRIWDYGSLVATVAVLVYVGGLFGDAPYVWYGASVELAACWNTMMLASVAYWVLNWAINYGMIVAWPDDQGFTD